MILKSILRPLASSDEAAERATAEIRSLCASAPVAVEVAAFAAAAVVTPIAIGLAADILMRGTQ